ncbi:hypothetical protein DFP73DRAFT_590415 [Morchella snyderi]|nr:hypothetical protein DFP73DRAFT_590415 [Morchella snyderi]
MAETTTELDHMAMVTTEICVSLERYPEAAADRIGLCGEYFTKIGNQTNTRIECDKKGNALFIHGGPKDVKKAYVELHELLKRLSISKTDSPIVDEAAEEEIKLLGKEFLSGAVFRKVSGGSIFQENTSNIYVLDPIHTNKLENGNDRVCASGMWDMKRFIEWKFVPEVIREASKVLMAQLRRLPLETEDYFKLEVSIGKVIFYENSNNYQLDGAKFAINDFCHLRETVSSFRKCLDAYLIEYLGDVLPKLRYNKEGNTFKTVKIRHIVGHKDGNSYVNVWSLDIPEGGKYADKKSRPLELSKVRVFKRSPFSATIHNPAKALDFKLSIIANARESAASTQEIEERISRTYRYSTKRGLLVNSEVARNHGYKPLVLAESRIFKETTWIRGNIKVSILEVEDGPESAFEVKVQNNQLKEYLRESPKEVPLDYAIATVKELFEAIEEIRDELSIFSSSKHPEGSLLKQGQKSEDKSRYSAREAVSTFSGIDAENGLRTKSLAHRTKYTTTEHVPDISPLKRLNHSSQRASPRNSSFCDSPSLGTVKPYATWEEGLIGDGSDLKTPVLMPIKIHSQIYQPAHHKSSPTAPEFLSEYDDTTGPSSVPVKPVRRNGIFKSQTRDLSLYGISCALGSSEKPSSCRGNPHPTNPTNPSQNFPSALFDMPDAGTSEGSPQDVKYSSTHDMIDLSDTKKIDFFGSIDPSADDGEQSVSCSPINRYHYPDECEDLLIF